MGAQWPRLASQLSPSKTSSPPLGSPVKRSGGLLGAPGCPVPLERVESKRYRLLHPRPVYVIVAAHGGRVNAMAASWVSPLSEEPERITVAFEKESYTYELVRASGEFTVNVVPASMLEAVWCLGTRSGRGRDKLAECGAAVEPSRSVEAPRLQGAIGVIEARVYKVYEDVAEDVDLVVADIVDAYADPSLFNPRYGWQVTKAEILFHASGRAFTTPGRLLLAGKR